MNFTHLSLSCPANYVDVSIDPPPPLLLFLDRLPPQSLMRKAENMRISSPSWMIIMGVRLAKEIKEMQKGVEREREGERGFFYCSTLTKEFKLFELCNR